jgi:hypothetical protein
MSEFKFNKDDFIGGINTVDPDKSWLSRIQCTCGNDPVAVRRPDPYRLVPVWCISCDRCGRAAIGGSFELALMAWTGGKRND